MSEQQLEVKEFDHPPLPKNWLRTVVIIWLGQAASILTAYSSIYAGVWFVTETTDSALMLALASLCSMLPQGLLAPLGGVLCQCQNGGLGVAAHRVEVAGADHAGHVSGETALY